jgi:RNase H-like domain found in reverse transcriptase
VAQFIRIVNRILEDLIPMCVRPFLDDIGVKGPRSRYGDEEVPELPGVRRFVMEHLRNLDAVLADLERAGVTVAGEKSKFCMAGLKIVGYVCDSDGRHPDQRKILAIIEWPDCQNTTEARAFLGVCVYYRIWVQDFAIIAAPIFKLFRKDSIFRWGPEQGEAMDTLKAALTTAPALMLIDYSEGAGKIFCGSDASLDGWGGHLSQEDSEGRRHLSRYESGIWSESERRYDAGKRECRALMKTLKKFRNYLYGMKFVVEVDAKTLVAQLNRSASDLPGALVTRWIAWINLFDFDVKHVPSKKHAIADGLSRRPGTGKEQDEEDINEFINSELDIVRIAPLTLLISRPCVVLLCPVELRAGEIREGAEEIGEENLAVLRYSEIEDDEQEEWEESEEESLRPEYSEESVKLARWLRTL